MLIALVFVFGLVSLLAGVWASCTSNRFLRDKDGSVARDRWGATTTNSTFEAAAAILIVGGLVALTFLLTAWPCSYFSSLNSVRQMEALLDSRVSIVAAIEQAQRVEILGAANDPTIIDLAYQQQSQAYTDLVRDCRDRVVAYNESWRRNSSFDKLPIFGPMRVHVPGHLEPLTEAFCAPSK